jgi:hypothetical protein
MEGSIQGVGNRVRVSAQLIDAETGDASGRSGSSATRAICLRCRARSRGGSRPLLAWIGVGRSQIVTLANVPSAGTSFTVI